MAQPRPTLDTLNARGKAEVEAKLPGAASRLPKTPESVLSTVSAGHAHGLYGRMERAERQRFPLYMDDDQVDESLRLYKVSDGQGGYGRIPAKKASGTINVTATSNATVNEGEELSFKGRLYTIDAGESYTFPAAGGTHEFAVTARVAGEDSNITVSPALVTFTSPPADVNENAVVVAIGGGTEQETLAAGKVRLQEAIRTPGAGGAAEDFRAMARASSTLVTRAWEKQRYNGQGTMLVLIANDNENPPTADAAVVAIAQAYLQDTDASGYITGEAPTTAIVTVQSVAAKALAVTASITIETGAVWEDDEGDGVKADVEAEIAALVARVAGARDGPGVTITTEEISGAIQRAAGVKSHTLTTPAADVTHTDLQIPYVGSHTLTQA
jgi:uncharacterized phage protein gp47/JayE